MTASERRIAAAPLQDFVTQVFTRAGLPPADAALEAEVLVWANLRGVDSHGVLRVDWYLDHMDKGYMNPRPQITILKDTPGVLYMEADRAFGPIPTMQALERVMEKARTIGIGWALIRNLTHQGAIGYYSEHAARHGLAGITIVCSPPNMVPHGARRAGVHNSPIAIAVPAGRHHPLVLDMATSIAAGGKLMLAQDKRIPLGEGWAVDAQGNPTTDALLAKYLLPAGGPKGSGLALMFQALTSQMANNPLITPVLGGEPNTFGQNSIVAAIDIGLFTDLEQYKAGIDELIDALKALPKAPGVEEILMPGEPEFNTLAQRTAHGIPIPPGTRDKLQAAAQRFGLDLPAELVA